MGKKYWLVIALSYAGIGTATVFAQTTEQDTSRYSASYEFYGRAPYPAYARGARLGYAPDSANEIQLTYFSSSQKVLLTDFSYQEVTLQLKRILGASTFYEVGAGARSVAVDSHAFLQQQEGEESRTRESIREEYRAINVNTGFGIEIPLSDNFLIGSSIFSVSIPVYWFEKNSNFPNNADDTEEDPKEFPYIKDGFKVNYQLIRTFIKVRL